MEDDKLCVQLDSLKDVKAKVSNSFLQFFDSNSELTTPIPFRRAETLPADFKVQETGQVEVKAEPFFTEAEDRSLSGSTGACSGPSPCSDKEGILNENRTTLMVRNIPTKVDQPCFLALLQVAGFPEVEAVRFFYLPIDLRSRKSLGYCFIDFDSPNRACEFWSKFQGAFLRPSSSKNLEISYARLQGVDDNMQLFKNSAAIHVLDRSLQPLVAAEGFYRLQPVSSVLKKL